MYKQCNYTRTMCHYNDIIYNIILFAHEYRTEVVQLVCGGSGVNKCRSSATLISAGCCCSHDSGVIMYYCYHFFFLLLLILFVRRFLIFIIILLSKIARVNLKTKRVSICGHTPSNVSCVSIPRFPSPFTARHP